MDRFNRDNRDNYNRDNYNNYERDNFGRANNNFDNTIDAREYSRNNPDGGYNGNYGANSYNGGGYEYNGGYSQSDYDRRKRDDSNNPARRYDYDDTVRRSSGYNSGRQYRQPDYMSNSYRQQDNGGYRAEQNYPAPPNYTPPPQKYQQAQPPQSTVEKSINDVMVRCPQNYNDIKNIINYLRNKQAVIVQVKDIAPDTAQRFLDFLTGAIYALNGSSEEVSRNLFLFTPQGVSINVTLDFKNKGKDGKR